MTILRRELAIKASDGVRSPPPHTDGELLSFPSGSREYFWNVRDEPWIQSFSINKGIQIIIVTYFALSPSVSPSPFLTHTHIAHARPFYRASYMGKVDKPYSVDPADKLTNWVHLSRKTLLKCDPCV